MQATVSLVPNNEQRAGGCALPARFVLQEEMVKNC
jgi:hypothetical protein